MNNGTNGSRVTVSIDRGTLALLWGIFVTLVGGLVFIVRMHSRVEELGLNVGKLSHQMDAHVSLPTHPVTGERITAISDRVTKVERKLGIQ